MPHGERVSGYLGGSKADAFPGASLLGGIPERLGASGG